MPGPINITGLPPMKAPSTSTLEERPGARIGAATYGDALRGSPRAPTGVSQSFSTFLEAQLRPELLRRACAETGQPLDLRLQPGYDHSYWFIQSFIADHLQHHARALHLE